MSSWQTRVILRGFFRVYGLGLRGVRVEGLRFRVEGLGFKVRVKSLGFRV